VRGSVADELMCKGAMSLLVMHPAQVAAERLSENTSREVMTAG
jgi:hypothetical protein